MAQLQDIPPEIVADAVARAVVDAVSEGGDQESIVRRALAGARGALGLAGGAHAPDTSASGPGPIVRGDGAASTLAGPIPPTRFSPPAPRPNGHGIPAALGSGRAAGSEAGGGRSVITEGDVLDTVRSGQTELRVAPGVIVTALARDAARDAGLRLVEG